MAKYKLEPKADNIIKGWIIENDYLRNTLEMDEAQKQTHYKKLPDSKKAQMSVATIAKTIGLYADGRIEAGKEQLTPLCKKLGELRERIGDQESKDAVAGLIDYTAKLAEDAGEPSRDEEAYKRIFNILTVPDVFNWVAASEILRFSLDDADTKKEFYWEVLDGEQRAKMAVGKIAKSLETGHRTSDGIVSAIRELEKYKKEMRMAEAESCTSDVINALHCELDAIMSVAHFISHVAGRCKDSAFLFNVFKEAGERGMDFRDFWMGRLAARNMSG